MSADEIAWTPWNFDRDCARFDGPDARAEVNGVVLEAFDDGSWAVGDETSDGQGAGGDLESAKAACVERLHAEPVDSAPRRAPTLFAIGADRWPGISKLVEECGEVVHVCGKLLGTYGERPHWDGTDLKERLQQELGDLEAAICFVVGLCYLDMDAIMARRDAKLKQFEHWHRQKTRVG